MECIPLITLLNLNIELSNYSNKNSQMFGFYACKVYETILKLLPYYSVHFVTPALWQKIFCEREGVKVINKGKNGVELYLQWKFIHEH